jgi:hypothetical protein
MAKNWIWKNSDACGSNGIPAPNLPIEKKELQAIFFD